MKNVLLRLARHLTSRRSVGLSLLAVLICLRIWDPAPLEELRLRSFDLYQSISPRSSPVRPVMPMKRILASRSCAASFGAEA